MTYGVSVKTTNQKELKPMMQITTEKKTYLSDDFAMFSDAGNEAVGDTLRELTRRGPVEPYQVRQALINLESRFIEADDTAVRMEAFQWLEDNGLLIDR